MLHKVENSTRVRISRSQFAICEPIFRICERRSSTASYFCESIFSQVESCSREKYSSILLHFYEIYKFITAAHVYAYFIDLLTYTLET